VRGWAKHTVCRRAVGGGGEPCEARITLLATHHRVVPHSGVYFLGGSGATWFQYGSVNIAIRGDRSCGTCRHITPLLRGGISQDQQKSLIIDLVQGSTSTQWAWRLGAKWGHPPSWTSRAKIHLVRALVAQWEWV
jgi:hypothetical protein